MEVQFSAVNLSYMETNLVHPTRRQSFAGKSDSAFWNSGNLSNIVAHISNFDKYARYQPSVDDLIQNSKDSW